VSIDLSLSRDRTFVHKCKAFGRRQRRRLWPRAAAATPAAAGRGQAAAGGEGKEII